MIVASFLAMTPMGYPKDRNRLSGADFAARQNPLRSDAFVLYNVSIDNCYTRERLKIPTAFAVGQRKRVLPARVYGKFKCSPVYAEGAEHEIFQAEQDFGTDQRS
jgi:hypothetical protein